MAWVEGKFITWRGLFGRHCVIRTQEMHSAYIQEISSGNRGSGKNCTYCSDSCPYAVPAPLADRGEEDSSVENGS